MATKDLSERKIKFHVEHNVTPNSVNTILLLFHSDDSLNSGEVYDRLSPPLWHSSKDEIKKSYLNKNLDVLNVFGIISKDEGRYEITDFGQKLQQCSQFNQNIYFDLMHYLYYTTWDVSKPETYFSWTYKKICDALWEIKPSTIDKNKLAGDVYNYATTYFPEISKIAISPYAVQGTRNWLRALNPPFVDVDGRNIRTNEGRQYCSPELFLLGVNFLYQENTISIGTPILIDRDKEIFLAKLCLLSINSVKNVLSLVMKIFPDFLKKHSSVWGNSVILSRKLEPIDILRR